VAKQTKERARTFVIPLFDYSVTVVVTNDIQASVDKHLPGVEVDGMTHACHCGVTNNMQSFIFLPTTASAGTIAHESFHCVWQLVQQIGAEPDNEVIAYTLSYLVNRITGMVGEARPKQRHKSVPVAPEPVGN